MIIETNRLILRPLTHHQLLQYLYGDPTLAKDLGLTESVTEISPELQDAIKNTVIPSVADPSRNYLYSTLWTLINKEEKRIIGDLCFFGEPNIVGEIEIGYGTYEAFRGCGYMTEAVEAMIGWAKDEPSVKRILASTGKENRASCSVLQKLHFTQYDETPTLFKWSLKLK